MSIRQLRRRTPRPSPTPTRCAASIGPGRAWWDVTFYDLHVRVDPADSSIRGWNGITYQVLAPAQEMQIDLQVPMEADSMLQDGKTLTWRRDGNAFFVTLPSAQRAGTRRTISVYYHGKPIAAIRPPWDGGFIWQHDSLGNRWVATANQGARRQRLVAEQGLPGRRARQPAHRDHRARPDDGRVERPAAEARRTTPTAPRRSNGSSPSPINNYDVAVNAGHYAHFSDVYEGERGKLTLDFWPLDYHLDTAKKQFQQVKPMLQCFESWFGPFPWYEDGYKLVETPHLGMEHQSAVAYGNHYKNGYYAGARGQERWIDFSGMGEGYKWDFIIVHESAHEWFGNSITMKDAADMWIHESFATYAEGLFTECQQGKKAGARYLIGSRRQIRNDAPIIGPYGVNGDGSGDMYYKGGSMLHTMRQVVDNDEKWRGVLRGLNKTFWHQTVTGRQVMDYINKQSGINFDPVFEQYLTTTRVPTLEYRVSDGTLSFRWVDVVPGFDMPVKVTLNGTGVFVDPPD